MTRFFTLVAALGLSACGGAGMPATLYGAAPALGGAEVVQPPSAPLKRSRQALLFVTHRDYSRVSFSAFALPLHRNERPSLERSGVSEPIPIVADRRDLFIASFNTDKIFTYRLPLGANSKRSSIVPDVGDPGGLALDGGYLFVSGVAHSGPNAVLEYKLPLVKGEAPTAFINNFPIVDELAVAAAGNTLFVASTTAGTVGAYHIPLKNNESPEYTINTEQQSDATTSVAVDRAARHLYVALSSLPYVYAYKLPYHGEMPRVMRLRGGELAEPLALGVGNDHLFVATAGGALWSYPMPITSQSHPDGHALVAGGGAGVAVSE